MTRRITWDEYFTSLAYTTSLRSTCSRLQVGAVLVRNFNVVSIGFNGAPKGIRHCVHADNSRCTLAVHAEANALIQASNAYGGTIGSMMYVTHAPCWECAKLIVNAQIDHVFYSEEYRSTDGLSMLKLAGIPYTKVEVEGER